MLPASSHLAGTPNNSSRCVSEVLNDFVDWHWVGGVSIWVEIDMGNTCAFQFDQQVSKGAEAGEFIRIKALAK
jgi:hypothetical protein